LRQAKEEENVWEESEHFGERSGTEQIDFAIAIAASGSALAGGQMLDRSRGRCLQIDQLR